MGLSTWMETSKTFLMCASIVLTFSAILPLVTSEWPFACPLFAGACLIIT